MSPSGKFAVGGVCELVCPSGDLLSCRSVATLLFKSCRRGC